MTSRWPETLQPANCEFGRQRNDAIPESPTSRKRQIVRRGRPLWTSKTTWRVPASRVSEMRYQLERLDGGRQAVRVRDYADPPFVYASNDPPNGASILAALTDEILIIDFTDSSFAGATSHYGAAVVKNANTWISVQSDAAIAATSIATTGWPVSSTAIVKSGQYLEVGEYLYVVSADASSDAFSNATLSLTTPLIAPAVVGDRVEVSIPRARMRPASPDWSGSRSANEALWTVDVEFVEAVA